MKAKLLLMYLHMTTKNLEDQVCMKELVLDLQANQEKQLQDGIQVKGMKIDLMAIVFLALILVIRLWNVDPMVEEAVEDTMTRLDVGHVTELGMLLLTVTP